IEKERIGSKTIKKHDKPKTPYQRIMDSEHIPITTKNALIKQLERLNPFELRNIIEMTLKKITRIR
ncbi:MAG: ISNCY family transposase, partial [Smithellaceae bacterium]